MMKTIGLKFVPYSGVITAIAGTLTYLQYLSGFCFMNDIRKKQSTEGFSVWPLLASISLCAMNLKFGYIINDDLTINVNYFGITLNILFVVAFYYFTPNENKSKLWEQIGISSIFTALSLLYTIWEDEKLIEFRLGMLITGILVFIVASPLFDTMRNQTTEGISFEMNLVGTFVSFAWLFYGFSILNDMIVYQCAFLGFLGVIQLFFFAVYPSTRTDIKTLKDKKTK